MFTCVHCGKQFAGASGLWYHKQKHGYKPRKRARRKSTNVRKEQLASAAPIVRKKRKKERIVATRVRHDDETTTKSFVCVPGTKKQNEDDLKWISENEIDPNQIDWIAALVEKKDQHLRSWDLPEAV